MNSTTNTDTNTELVLNVVKTDNGATINGEEYQFFQNDNVHGFFNKDVDPNDIELWTQLHSNPEIYENYFKTK